MAALAHSTYTRMQTPAHVLGGAGLLAGWLAGWPGVQFIPSFGFVVFVN
jgi:hypothetical protein